MINQIRYQQQSGQARAVREQGSNPTVATYGARDSTTGQRIISYGCGGTGRAVYTSLTEPRQFVAIASIGSSGVAPQIINY